MSHLRKYLLVSFLVLSLACNALAQAVPPTPTSAPAAPASETPAPADTATAQPAATDTPAAAPTDTPAPATATIDPAEATTMAQMGSMGALEMGVSFYLHPVGTPVKIFNDVPIMPQATAGQQFTAGIYSYIAAATLEQAGQFYAGKVQSLGLMSLPGHGSGGSGSQASHNISYLSFQRTIYMMSYDNDLKHVIVVISVVP